MDSAISKILSQVYELEGLLLVIDKHGEETPEVVYNNIREHAATIHEMSQLLEKPVTSPIQHPQELVYGPPVTHEDIVTQDEAINEDAKNDVIQDEIDIINEDVSNNIDEEPHELFKFTIPEQKEQEQPLEYSSGETTMAMRVDEKLQRSMSKDLRRAFSVNDRFRFRRELFGNNEADFVDAINMIEAMHSYDEATEYFLNDLGWDEDIPEVNEFLNIVRHHFDA